MDTDLSKMGEAFRPVGRLFLSADLVGSTAHKQLPAFQASGNEPNWSELDLSPPWLRPIGDFFSRFGPIFNTAWDEICSIARAKSLPHGNPPELWKANGDELIFVKEVDDRRELYCCVCAWLLALKRYRERSDKTGHLEIKGTAWFAGFPVSNSEVIFWRDFRDYESKFPDDDRLEQIHLRERWSKNSRDRRRLLRDFVGPAIDTGFRLSNLATARKMVISLDVAYLLATAQIPRGRRETFLEWFRIVYGGKVSLKGVMNGTPYPLFWIDVGHDLKMNSVEDELSTPILYIDEERISKYCEIFYEKNKSFFLVPFLIKEDASQEGVVPSSYKDFLIGRYRKWQAEKKRYELEKVDSADSSGRNLSKAKIQEFGETVRDPKGGTGLT